MGNLLTKIAASSLALVGGLVGAGAYPEKAEAQRPRVRIPLALDYTINNPYLPISHRDRHLLNHINRLNFILAINHPDNRRPHVNRRRPVRIVRPVVNHYHLDARDGRKDGKIKPSYIPQTFIANCYVDMNRNDRNGKRTVDYDEFIGLGSKSFEKNEKVTLGFWLPINGIKGKRATIRVYDPAGNIVNRDGLTGIIPIKETPPSKYSKEWTIPKNNYSSWMSFSAKELIEARGPGTYAAAFYIDGHHLNTKQFKIKK